MSSLDRSGSTGLGCCRVPTRRLHRIQTAIEHIKRTFKHTYLNFTSWRVHVCATRLSSNLRRPLPLGCQDTLGRCYGKRPTLMTQSPSGVVWCRFRRSDSSWVLCTRLLKVKKCVKANRTINHRAQADPFTTLRIRAGSIPVDRATSQLFLQ